MSPRTQPIRGLLRQLPMFVLGLLAVASGLAPCNARALPVTEQVWPDCVACDVGDGLPEFDTVLPGAALRGVSVAGSSVYTYQSQTLRAQLGLRPSRLHAASAFNGDALDAGSRMFDPLGNSYWQLALTRVSGPYTVTLGSAGTVARSYDLGSNTSDPNNTSLLRSAGLNAQSRYSLDPHAIIGQLTYMRQVQSYSVNTLAAPAPSYSQADTATAAAPLNSSETTNTLRKKFTYVYQGQYGGSVAFFRRSTNASATNPGAAYATLQQQTSIGHLGTRGATYELFWTPDQNIRLGAQYTAYSQFNGTDSSYDAYGLRAKDNNTLFGYVWFAY